MVSKSSQGPITLNVRSNKIYRGSWDRWLGGHDKMLEFNLTQTKQLAENQPEVEEVLNMNVKDVIK